MLNISIDLHVYFFLKYSLCLKIKNNLMEKFVVFKHECNQGNT